MPALGPRAELLQVQPRLGLQHAQERADAVVTLHLGQFASGEDPLVVTVHQLPHPLLIVGGELDRENRARRFWRQDQPIQDRRFNVYSVWSHGVIIASLRSEESGSAPSRRAALGRGGS